MKIITENGLTWTDIEKPSQKDLDWLKNNFNIHTIVLDELIPASQREKVEYFDNYMFLAMHVPVFHQAKKTTKPIELDILIAENQLITIHNEPIEPLKDFIKKCEEKADLKSKCFGSTSGHLFYWLSEELLNFGERQLVHIGKNIDRIEDNMFNGMERELIKELLIVKRDILDFRIAIRPLCRIFHSLANRGINFWPEKSDDLKIYFNDLIGDYERVWNEIDNYTGTINALEDTHANLLSNKTNTIIRTFTILSFITFPAMLVASILQINPDGRWIIATTILFTTIFMWAYFKTKKWL
ncbi:MAG: CorA family divalent cation transporter [Candidatus Azambacteria bacterium]|nr:CorA family divalent cation transporter [Candidatus Azambacteria bacterium]